MTAEPAWRNRLNAIVDGRGFQAVVVTLICLNALVLGLETFDRLDHLAPIFVLIDLAFVTLFTVELVLRLAAKGKSFFNSPWNIFDFVIIVGGLLAASNLAAALRAFRILRLLRVITVIPRMRVVVKALIDSIPGIVSVAMVAMLIVYIFAVIASMLYGETHPGYFGDVFTSMYTLFQVITLEGWRDIADAVQEDHDFAWLFFVIFVLIGTFTMLNLFIAIVVRVVEEESDEVEGLVREETDEVLAAVRQLDSRLDRIEADIRRRTS